MGSTSTAISPKVAAATVAGGIATILVWLIGLTGVNVPPEVSAAIATVLAGGAGYLVRDRARDVGQVVIEDTKATGEPTFDPPVREELELAESDDPKSDAAHHGG